MTRRLAVNVDVDSLDLYHAIHGIDSAAAGDEAWEVGVPRFVELFARRGLKATFFVVAADLERAGPRRVAAKLVEAGHELASHTWSHPYDLIRRSRAEIESEIAAAEAPLEALRRRRVAGFRAPGYNISADVLEVLAERGYAYDSSLLPCPPYYAARAAMIAGMRLTGRKSRSIVGDPRSAFGPRTPHRTTSGLLELPMTVLPGARIPLIGTTLAMMGELGATALRPLLSRMRFVNLEFHAIDLMDFADLPGSNLPRYQPDLRRMVRQKRPAYDAVLRACRGAENDTLEGFAARW